MGFKPGSYPGLPGIGPTKSKKVKTHRASQLFIFSILVLLWYLRVSCLHTSPHLFDRHALPDLYEVSIEELQDGLDKGLFTSVDLVKAYFARIDEVNLKGPALHAVLEMNPMALEQAAALDKERRTNGPRGPLHGIPIMLKDNIATVASEGMNTTAGSFALVGSIPPRDATVVAKLRKAGAILLGKSNLSEWSHARGTLATGWSGRGGQTTCAYYPGGDASGSSSGSGVSSSIGLAAVALGTETNGSIVFPCSKNNLVGIKPTVGLTSRAGVIPISAHQDTVGPMARSLADAVTVLTAIIGPDPLDNYTLAQPMPLPDYSSALVRGGLKGARLGVPRRLFPEDENMAAAFNATLSVMEDLGAIVVDSAELPSTDEQIASQNQSLKLNVDLKFDLAKYMDELLEVPTGVKNLTDLIAYNLAHSDQELPAPWYTSQEIFLKAENVTQDEAYYAAIAADYDLGRTRGIDGVMKMYDLDALILPSEGWGSPAAAIAGYPIVAIPLGFQSDDVSPTPAEPIVKRAPGMPFGMVFVGTAFDEYRLIHLAYDYEQATQTRLKQRAFPAAIPKTQLVDVIRRR